MLTLRSWIRAQPQRDVGWLHRLSHHPFHVAAQGLQIRLLAQPDDLVIEAGDEPGRTQQTATSPRDRAWWESNASVTFLATVDEIAKYCIQDIGPSRVDYSAQSYVSLKKVRRAWLPMWPRVNGAYVYLPGGANPIGFAIPHEKATHSAVREILTAAYELA